MNSLTLAIEGMTCSSCTGTIERVLGALDGVDKLSVVVALLSNSANLSYDSSVITSSDIVSSIEDVGFDARVLEDKHPKKPDNNSVPKYSLALAVEGMTCSSCTGTIERVLGALDGVDKLSVVVALLSNSANLSYDSSVITSSDIVSSIEDVGFDARVLEDKLMFDPNLDRESESDSDSYKDYIVTCVNEKLLAEQQEQSTMSFIFSVLRLCVFRTFSFLVPLLQYLFDFCDPVRKQYIDTYQSVVPSRTLDSSGSEEKNAYSEAAVASIADTLINVDGVGHVDISNALTEGYIVLRVKESVFGPRRIVALFKTEFDLTVTISSLGGFMNAARMMKLHNKEMLQAFSTMYLALFLTIPVLFITMLLPKDTNHWRSELVVPGLTVQSFLLFILVTPVQFGLGWVFHVKAYKNVKARSLGKCIMNSKCFL